MDLEAQAKNAKIQAVRFFNEFKEVEKTANTALSNSISLQSELSTVQIDLKSLIESLQVNFDSGVQNIQNQINEVTNVVIQEQETRKSETEALEQQIFAQEDQLQKNVKGKKAKKVAPDSFAGKMRQKLRDKAKENLGSLGLIGAGMGLAALGGTGNWFTGLFDRIKNFDGTPGSGLGKKEENTEENIEENVGDNAFGFGNPFDTDLGIGDDAFGFGSPFDTDLGIGDDGFGFGSFDTTEIIKNVIDEKSDGVSGEQQLLLTLEKRKNKIDDMIELNKAINMEKDVRSMNAERKTIEEAINNLKLNKKDNKFGANDYLQELKKDKTTILSDESISGDLTTITVDGKKYPRGLGLGYNPFGTEGGSTYGDSRYDPYSLINDNNSGNEVIDGGTTVIEGGTEVVDGGTVGNNQRGEVRTSTSIVKSTNSPVIAVQLSESNSVKELAIGA